MKQTYNGTDGKSLDAYSTLSYQISFDSNKNWRTKALYQLAFREGCKYHQLEYNFDYIVSDLTRQISDMNSDWDLTGKHASFYCGSAPDNKERFFLDEVLIIAGQYGVTEEVFTRNGTVMVTMNDNSYETVVFVLNSTLSELNII